MNIQSKLDEIFHDAVEYNGPSYASGFLMGLVETLVHFIPEESQNDVLEILENIEIPKNG